MTTEEVSYLRGLLDRMQENDPGLRLFGSTIHKYGLGAPLAENELSAFERKHGVILPPDYRSFLSQAGNGSVVRSKARIFAVNSGAGPDYGLLPIEEIADDCDPAATFPLMTVRHEWDEDHPWPGVLKISFAGCANCSYLVVNGPAYGTVWRANFDYEEFIPTGLTFGDWYRRWVDSLVTVVLPVLTHERLVENVRVGMSKAEVIGVCGGQWEEIGTMYRYLRFRHLATEFELDEQDRVKRIVHHSVYPQMPYIAPEP